MNSTHVKHCSLEVYYSTTILVNTGVTLLVFDALVNEINVFKCANTHKTTINKLSYSKLMS